MTTEMMTPADVAAVCNGGGRNNDGMFGGDGWWILLLFLFAGGWGNGFGGFGGNGGGSGFQGYATRADINEGFALNQLQNGIQAIQQGLCDSTYALNNTIQGGFSANQMALSQGFNGVERGFCDLSAQLAQCCCDNREAIAQVRYDMATQACDTRNVIQTTTRDIIDNANANNRAILDFLVQDKLDALRDENQELRRAASQDRQNAYFTTALQAQTSQLIDRIAPYPVPAWQVPNPNCCSQQYAWNGCGCGCNA